MNKLKEKKKSSNYSDEIRLEAHALASQLREIVDNCQNEMCPYYYNAMCIITLSREVSNLKERIKQLERDILNTNGTVNI